MPSSFEPVSRDQEKVQWHGPKKMGGGGDGGGGNQGFSL